MDAFYPFVYQPAPKKKEELEQLPLYIELEPPPQKEEQEPKEEQRVIIIELF